VTDALPVWSLKGASRVVLQPSAAATSRGGHRFRLRRRVTFWCCQGTGLETQTKLADSIYFYHDTTLLVNLFLPSVLTWTQRGITVTQTTSYPVSDTTTLTVTGSVSGTWDMRIRIPAWTSGAIISVNGATQNVTTTPPAVTPP
jgi:DUF1680 family protein